MIFNDNSLENVILSALSGGSLSTAKLLEKAHHTRPVTKQGFYLALRLLKQKEMVVVHSKQVSLSVRWLKKLEDYVAIATSTHTGGGFHNYNFLELKDGEKISYSFNDTNQTDSFWWQALYLFSETVTDTNEPACLYNPHQWFFIARKESEIESLQTISKKHKYLVLACNKTPLDKHVAQYFDGKQSQYHMLEAPLYEKENYYYNVVGDYVLEALIDSHQIKAIEKLYKETDVVTDEVYAKMQRIIGVKGRSRLSISRNKQKAEKLKREFKKYFVI